ncbi:hypothetical protein DVH24_035613 [Malus domestica]|uniref:DNA-directed RNA polymerase III subunit RPC3 n=1 Tax=Malus domestica TaxID=3750 RepID=A0A498JP86_MALDO|nr:hypothetical protein DVH24_035613 [Malus domestica]
MYEGGEEDVGGITFDNILHRWRDYSNQGSSSTRSLRSAGGKRKHDALEQLNSWRATFEEFVRCLRHKACVENVRARRLVDDEAAVLALREMLKSTRTAEKKVQTENSVPLSINTISEEAINGEAGRSLIRDCVKAALS